MTEKTDVELAVFVADYLKVELEQLRNQPPKNIIQALPDYSKDEGFQIIRRLENGGFIPDNTHEELPR
jgi:hypothetical protein